MQHQTPASHAGTLFPARLHALLDDAAKNGNDDIISWLPDGRSFKVHDKVRFEKDIMPKYFGSSKYRSFQKNLNLWEFKTVLAPLNTSSRGECSHPLFVRGSPDLCQAMRRVVKSKLVKQDAAHTADATTATPIASARPLATHEGSDLSSSHHGQRASSGSAGTRGPPVAAVAAVPNGQQALERRLSSSHMNNTSDDGNNDVAVALSRIQQMLLDQTAPGVYSNLLERSNLLLGLSNRSHADGGVYGGHVDRDSPLVQHIRAGDRGKHQATTTSTPAPTNAASSSSSRRNSLALLGTAAAATAAAAASGTTSNTQEFLRATRRRSSLTHHQPSSSSRTDDAKTAAPNNKDHVIGTSRNHHLPEQAMPSSSSAPTASSHLPSHHVSSSNASTAAATAPTDTDQGDVAATISSLFLIAAGGGGDRAGSSAERKKDANETSRVVESGCGTVDTTNNMASSVEDLLTLSLPTTTSTGSPRVRAPQSNDGVVGRDDDKNNNTSNWSQIVQDAAASAALLLRQEQRRRRNGDAAQHHAPSDTTSSAVGAAGGRSMAVAPLDEEQERQLSSIIALGQLLERAPASPAVAASLSSSLHQPMSSSHLESLLSSPSMSEVLLSQIVGGRRDRSSDRGIDASSGGGSLLSSTLEAISTSAALERQILNEHRLLLEARMYNDKLSQILDLLHKLRN